VQQLVTSTCFNGEKKFMIFLKNICGARLTTNICRIGGFEKIGLLKVWDLINEFLEGFPAALKEFHCLS
jgi:NADH:ubiquinone oxidoreductase subunit D